MKGSEWKAVAVKDDRSKDPGWIESCGHGDGPPPGVTKNPAVAGVYRGARVYTRAYFGIPGGGAGMEGGIYCISDRLAQARFIDRPLPGTLKPAIHARV